MEKIVRQAAGIDVSQKELVACLGRMDVSLEPELYAAKTFANTPKGFAALVEWTEKFTDANAPLRFVMEATGVYHEGLAYYLFDNGHTLSIVRPNKISNYFRTLEVKTVTDATASRSIALFGLERRLDDWQRPGPTYKRLRQLVRERAQLIVERTCIKNQLHAEKAEAEPNQQSIGRMKERIALLAKQEKAILAQVQQIVKGDEKAGAAVKLLCTIPGIGPLTAVTVLAETNGFELIANKRQLASYAGLDVVQKQSGTSVQGRPRISKRGNKYLRSAMFLPALSAIKSDERVKAFFARIVAAKGIKMKAGVAVQRKLLEMTYTIFKSGQPYDKNYLEKNALAKTALPCKTPIGHIFIENQGSHKLTALNRLAFAALGNKFKKKLLAFNTESFFDKKKSKSENNRKVRVVTM
jgi:transposase